MGIVNQYSVEVKQPHTQDAGWVVFNVKRAAEYLFYVAISKWPTGNCQLSSVAYIDRLLNSTQNNKDDCIAILKECYRLLGMTPTLIIMDVKQTLMPQMKSIFNIIHEKPYTSTNGSFMCLYLVKLEA